jgi:hypothetical protein
MKKELAETKDEYGKVTFAAAVYHDEELTMERKRELLTECVMTLKGRECADAENYLARLNQQLESEFRRF